MKKSELKTGMSCVTRNGNCYRVFVIDESVTLVDGKIFLNSSVKDDLTNSAEALDIVKVYGRPDHVDLLDPSVHSVLPLWEREEGPELPKYYRLMKEGEVIGKFDKFWTADVGPWKRAVDSVRVGTAFNPEEDAVFVTPDIEVPEGYELWHVAGEEAPKEIVPEGAELILADDPRDHWSSSAHIGKRVRTHAAEDFHYAIPIAKPQEEKVLVVNGKEFSESTVAAALREYVK